MTDSNRVAKLGEKQTVLEMLMVLSYNLGREHGKQVTFDAYEAKMLMLTHLTKLIENIDPGDLNRPAEGLLFAVNRHGFIPDPEG